MLHISGELGGDSAGGGGGGPSASSLGGGIGGGIGASSASSSVEINDTWPTITSSTLSSELESSSSSLFANEIGADAVSVLDWIRFLVRKLENNQKNCDYTNGKSYRCWNWMICQVRFAVVGVVVVVAKAVFRNAFAFENQHCVGDWQALVAFLRPATLNNIETNRVDLERRQVWSVSATHTHRRIDVACVSPRQLASAKFHQSHCKRKRVCRSTELLLSFHFWPQLFRCLCRKTMF